MIFETSWDDCGKFDDRLVLLLMKYKMPATFYAPINCQMGMNWVSEISNSFEVGCHTVTHPEDLKRVPQPFLDYEIKSAKEMLETAINKKVHKFCYPGGKFNDVVAHVVKEAGFSEARTVTVLKTDKGSDPMRIPTTIHIYNRREYNGRDWYDLAIEMYDKAKTENSYFHIWGHSFELEKYDYWNKLETFFQYVNENPYIK